MVLNEELVVALNDLSILQESDNLRISQASKEYNEALKKYSSVGNPSRSLISLLIIYIIFWSTYTEYPIAATWNTQRRVETSSAYTCVDSY